LMVWSIVIY